MGHPVDPARACVPSLHVDEYNDDLEEGTLRSVLMAGEEAVPLGDVDVHEEAPDSHEDAEDDHDHEVEVRLQRRQVSQLQVAGLVQDRHQEKRGSLKESNNTNNTQDWPLTPSTSLDISKSSTKRQNELLLWFG